MPNVFVRRILAYVTAGKLLSICVESISHCNSSYLKIGIIPFPSKTFRDILILYLKTRTPNQISDDLEYEAHYLFVISNSKIANEIPNYHLNYTNAPKY